MKNLITKFKILLFVVNFLYFSSELKAQDIHASKSLATEEEEIETKTDLELLFEAVKDNNIDDVYSYTAKNGNKNLIAECDSEGMSPFHRAIEKGSYDIVKFFIANDPYEDDPTKSIIHASTIDDWQYTPLGLAAKGGTYDHSRCIDLLIKAKADIEYTKNGLTPLQIAVSYGKIETALKLINLGANPDVRDINGHTLLHLAAMSDQAMMVEQLLKLKININEEDKNKMTALHKGIANERIVKILLPFYALPLKFWSFQKEMGNCQGLAISHDGSILAIASFDHTVKLYAPNSEILGTLHGHEDRVYDVAFEPSGDFLASASADGTIKLWSIKNGTCIYTLKGHKGSVNAVAFSPDGRILASAGSDNNIRLWNPENGTLINKIKGHRLAVSDLAFSPDSTLLASSSYDNTVQIWSVDLGANMCTFNGHSSYVRSVDFSPDGLTVASSGSDKTIKVWSLDSRKCKYTIKGHNCTVANVAFNPDGTIIASASTDCTVKLWNAKNGQLLCSFDEYKQPIYDLAFSKDGTTLVSISGDNTIRYYYLCFDNILHQAIRNNNLNIVKMIVHIFPLLRFIRTSDNQSPSELAKKILAEEISAQETPEHSYDDASSGS